MSYDDAEKEAEANLFAMCLLMPEASVRKEVKELGGISMFNINKPIKYLANKFRVEEGVMLLRLQQLGLIDGM